MTTLGEITHRLDVASELQSVVRTMKTISAVGIRKHEAAEHASRRYLETIEAGIQVALRELPGYRPPRSLASHAPSAVVIIGSEIGLCGSLNDRIVTYALASLADAGVDPHLQRIITVGARADASWRSRQGKAFAHEAAPETLEAISRKAGAILTRLEQWQREDSVSSLVLYHHRPAGRGRSEPVHTRLLPLDSHWLDALRARPWASRRLPAIMEPAETLLQRLIRQLLFARVFAALVQARTAEFSVRLSAMQAADRNIADKIDDLRSTQRLVRQDIITSELLDLVAGYEAATTGSEDEPRK
jgi:F-type H+-transporting ATPase subunit gamma